MKLEIFTLCDHVADYGGKLCITGAFDRIRSAQEPELIRHCAVCARIRFEPVEETVHKVRISFVDEDGKDIAPPVNGQIDIRFPDKGRTQTMNFVMNFQNLKLPKFGEYRLDFAVGGIQLGSIPLYFDQIVKPQA